MSSLAEVRRTIFMLSQGSDTGVSSYAILQPRLLRLKRVVARRIMPLPCTATHGPGATVINQPVPATQASMQQR